MFTDSETYDKWLCSPLPRLVARRGARLQAAAAPDRGTRAARPPLRCSRVAVQQSDAAGQTHRREFCRYSTLKHTTALQHYSTLQHTAASE